MGNFSQQQQFNNGGLQEIEALSLNNSQIRFYEGEMSPEK